MGTLKDIRRPSGVELLPRRFRDYIESLERAAAASEAALTGEHQGSRLTLVDHLTAPRPVSDKLICRFVMGDTDLDRIDVMLAGSSRLAEGLGPAQLEISGMSQLVVAPRVSNVITVGIARR